MGDSTLDDGTRAGPGAPLPAGPGPWGPWATVGFSLVAAGIFAVAQSIVGVAFGMAEYIRNPRLAPAALAASLERNGLLLMLLCIVMHSLVSFVAMVETALGVR